MLLDTRKFIILFSIIYILTCQVILPSFNKKDFFIFFTWKLFSGKVEKNMQDYTWDNGKTFLFRDHKALLDKNINRNFRKSFFAYTQKRKFHYLKKNYSPLLKKMLPKKDIYIHQLNNKLYGFYVARNNPKTKSKRRVVSSDQ